MGFGAGPVGVPLAIAIILLDVQLVLPIIRSRTSTLSCATFTVHYESDKNLRKKDIAATN